MPTWDVVVVGAGPAGATAALCLASRGLSVALLDRARFPRDKTCGDALIPDALRCLERLGLLETVRARARALRTLTVYSPSRIAVELPGEFLTLPRRRFDHLLVEAARARGATFIQGHATAVVPARDGTAAVRWTARRPGGPGAAPVSSADAELADDPGLALERGRDAVVFQRSAPSGAVRPVGGAAADGAGGAGGVSELRGRVVLLATGADVRLLEECGMVDRAEPSAFALRQYVRSELRLDNLVVAFDREILPGYAWIFPLPDGEYNVGCGVFGGGRRAREVGLRALFDTFVREFPLATELMRRGEVVSPLRGARLRCGLSGARPFRAPNVLAIGETIGTTFPFTGEGIGKAMETAEIAASVVAEALVSGDMGRLAAYPERVRSLEPRYLGYRVAERWIRSAFLSDLLAKRVLRSERLRGAAAGVLNETVDPRQVFSARALIGSVWR